MFILILIILICISLVYCSKSKKVEAYCYYSYHVYRQEICQASECVYVQIIISDRLRVGVSH